MTDSCLEDSKLLKRKPGKTIDSDIHPRFIIHNNITGKFSPSYSVKQKKLSDMTKEFKKSWKVMQDQLAELKEVQAINPVLRKNSNLEAEEANGKFWNEVLKTHAIDSDARISTGSSDQDKLPIYGKKNSLLIQKSKLDIELYLGSPMPLIHCKPDITNGLNIKEVSQSKEASVNPSPSRNGNQRKRAKMGQKRVIKSKLDTKSKPSTAFPSRQDSILTTTKYLKPVKLKEENLKYTLENLIRKKHDSHSETSDFLLDCASFCNEDISASLSSGSSDMSRSSSYANLSLKKSSTTYSRFNLNSVIQNRQYSVSRQDIPIYNKSLTRPKTSYIPNFQRLRTAQLNQSQIAWKRTKKNQFSDLLINGHKSQILPKQIKNRNLTPSLSKSNISSDFTGYDIKIRDISKEEKASIQVPPYVKPRDKQQYKKVKRALHSEPKLKPLLD